MGMGVGKAFNAWVKLSCGVGHDVDGTGGVSPRSGLHE